MRRSLSIVVHASGAIDLHKRYFSHRLTLGGAGWVELFSSVASFRRDLIRQGIAFFGHANDGANGQPLAPTDECPF